MSNYNISEAIEESVHNFEFQIYDDEPRHVSIVKLWMRDEDKDKFGVEIVLFPNESIVEQEAKIRHGIAGLDWELVQGKADKILEGCEFPRIR